MTLQEAIAALAEHPVDDVIAALPHGAGSIYQTIFRKGYGDAKGPESERAERAEAEKAVLEQRVADLTEKLRKAEASAPDIEKVRAEFEDEREKLEAKHAKVVEQLTTRLENAEYGSAISTLEAKMLERGLKPLYARTRAKDLRERIRFDKDGKRTVVEKGRDAVPIQVKDGQDALDALADEAYNEAEADEKIVRVPGGPGVRNAIQNGAPGGRVAELEKIQKDVREKTANADDRREKKLAKIGLA